VVPDPESPTDADGAASKGIQRRAVKGFSWAAISFGGNKFLVFVSTLVLTRLLAPAEFGVVAAGLTVIAYLEVTLDLGMSSAIVYQQEEGQSRSVAVAFTTNVTLCTILAGLNFLTAPAVAAFFRVPDSAAIFRALSLYILIRGVGALQTALLQRDLRFREKAAADVTRAMVRGAVGIGLAFGGAGAWALIWALIVGELAGTAVSWVQTRFRPRLAFDRATALLMLRFGAPVAALQLLAELASNSDYLVVGHQLGSEALGFYSIAYRLPELLLSNVYWIFSSVAFPIFSKARTVGAAAFRGSMLKALRLITMFGFPVSVGLALVSRDAVLVLFGGNWTDAGMPMTLISLAIGLGSVGYASGDIFKAAGRPGLLLWINGISTVIMITGFILAAPYGITAVAAVHLSYNLLYAHVRLALANRYIGTSMLDALRAMRPALTISAGIALFGLPVRLLVPTGQFALAAIILAGIAGAGLGLVASGRGTVEEIRELAGDLSSRHP
jgi:lipopolysaccharide exporter